MILSNDNLLFDIQGINGEEARESAISDVLDSLDRLFQPENTFGHSDYILQSETSAENMQSGAPVYHHEISAENLKPVDQFSQSETKLENLESFSHQFQSKNSIKTLGSQASQSSSEIAVKNGTDALIELLTLESKKARAKICLRCNKFNRTDTRRCKYCGAKITPPFIETKLKKLDDFLRKIFFPYN